jgi:hypothetical protein
MYIWLLDWMIAKCILVASSSDNIIQFTNLMICELALGFNNQYYPHVPE